MPETDPEDKISFDSVYQTRANPIVFREVMILLVHFVRLDFRPGVWPKPTCMEGRMITVLFEEFAGESTTTQ